MKLPPKASVGSGQPSVWMTASSGRFTSQISFTPSAKSCGLGDADLLPLAPRLAERTARSFGDDRDLRGEVGRLRVARARLSRRDRGPDGVVRTPRTAVPSTSSASAGKPGEEVDAELLGALAEPADDLADRRRVVAAVVHRRRRRHPLGAALGQEVDRLAGHGLAEREVGGLELGEQLAEGAGIDDRAGEIVLAQAVGLLEHADVELRHVATALPFALDQPRELDGAGQAAGPAPTISTSISIASAPGGSRQDEPVERQRGLMADGKDRGHDGSWRMKVRTAAAEYTSGRAAVCFCAWTSERRRGTHGSGDRSR